MTAIITELSELEDLPVGSVILAQFPAGSGEKHPNGRDWWFAGSHVVYRPDTVPLPARVLWVPDR